MMSERISRISIYVILVGLGILVGFIVKDYSLSRISSARAEELAPDVALESSPDLSSDLTQELTPRRTSYMSRKIESGEMRIANNVAYIAMDLEGDSTKLMILEPALYALAKFQERKNVRITSWCFDKQPATDSGKARVLGLCITFEPNEP